MPITQVDPRPKGRHRGSACAPCVTITVASLVLALGALFAARDGLWPGVLSPTREDVAYVDDEAAWLACSAEPADADLGRALFASTCATCHGPRAQGMPRQGANLRVSPFVAGETDRKLLAFLRSGRQPTSKGNLTGQLMPPRGGNAALDDARLRDIIAFLREVQDEAAEAGEKPQPSAPAQSPAAAASAAGLVMPVAKAAPN